MLRAGGGGAVVGRVAAAKGYLAYARPLAAHPNPCIPTRRSPSLPLQGGRHTPFVVNYKPQFFMRTADVTGTVTALKEGAEMVMPGAWQGAREREGGRAVAHPRGEQGDPAATRILHRPPPSTFTLPRRRRQHDGDDRADEQCRHDRGPAVRDPRGRAHRGRGRRVQGARVNGTQRRGGGCGASAAAATAMRVRARSGWQRRGPAH